MFICFVFFPLKIAFHVFRHLLLGYWSFILAVWNFMYWGNQPFVNYVTNIFPQIFLFFFFFFLFFKKFNSPRFSFNFCLWLFFFFCHRHLLNIYVVKYITLPFCASISCALKAFCKFQYLPLVTVFIFKFLFCWFLFWWLNWGQSLDT